jgi:hypothetical protein
MSSTTPSAHERVRGFVRHTGLAAGLVSLLSVGVACLFIAPSAFAQPPGTSTTVSQPVSSSINLGGSNTDSATVTASGDGDVAPTGSVAFYACGPTATAEPCTPTGSPFDTESLASNTDNPVTVTTQTAFTPTGAGTWCFASVYSGDDNYSGSSDETTDECFTVDTGTSTTVSQPGNSSINLGNSNTDSATVTGSVSGVAPTGSVAFYACGPTATAETCTPSGSPFDTESLAGNADNPVTVTTQTAFTPAGAGTWCFAAVYSGDSNYSGSNDETTDECFIVGTGTSTTVTKPTSKKISLGTSNTDSAKITGSASGVAPTGSVAFYACGPTATAETCTPSGSPFDTESLAGNAVNPVTVTTQTAFTPDAVGTWCFAAIYSGDSNYSGSNDETTDECFSVIEATSTTVSQVSSRADGLVKYFDTATVTGNATLGDPTGSVTFYECGPNPPMQGCTDEVNDLGTVTLTAGADHNASAKSPGFKPTTAGTYCFGAYYSGDSNYLNSNDTGYAGAECFNAGPSPTITSFSPTSAKPGTKLTINGKNLSGATEVVIGGVDVTKILTDSGTRITVDVPAGAASEKTIEVVTEFGSGTSKSKLKVT